MRARGPAGLAGKITRLEDHVRRVRGRSTTADFGAGDTTCLLNRAGLSADPWQERVLASTAQRLLLLCSRQSGKSTVAAALALQVALLQPHAPVLLLSPTLRQSVELFRKILALLDTLGRPLPVVGETTQKLEFGNGSRILALPGTEETVRGFSGVRLLLIDEAARVTDGLYFAVRPMLAVGGGRLVALSTPFGQRGWFHDEWHGAGTWERVRVQARECPRIGRAFLEEERLSLGPRWFAQEYECSFEGATGAVFDPEDIRAALRTDVLPLGVA